MDNKFKMNAVLHSFEWGEDVVNRSINRIGLTVPSIEEATAFFKQGLDGKIAYNSQTKNDEPRGDEYIEHILGLEKGTLIIHKRMMVFGRGSNIGMPELRHAQQHEPQSLQDTGFTHIPFYTESDEFEHVLEHVKQAGGEPLSEPCSNAKYGNIESNKTVYIRAPQGSLAELQTVLNGFYYPKDSGARIFVFKSSDK